MATNAIGAIGQQGQQNPSGYDALGEVDLGDFINHCVLWTTENEYGVVPTVLFNRPSRYTRFREMRNRRAREYNDYRGDQVSLINLDLPRVRESPTLSPKRK